MQRGTPTAPRMYPNSSQHGAPCIPTPAVGTRLRWRRLLSPDGERGNVRARRERAAKQICRNCPVPTACRRLRLTATESYGIWGGMSETERARRTHLPARPREHVVSTDPLTWRIRTPRA
jgi:WhiB family redox-sensing transcriptional regulator